LEGDDWLPRGTARLSQVAHNYVGASPQASANLRYGQIQGKAEKTSLYNRLLNFNDYVVNKIHTPKTHNWVR